MKCTRSMIRKAENVFVCILKPSFSYHYYPN
jgi:hypothetical protein